jgi:membrane fusion protein (multidrug efflux system)
MAPQQAVSRDPKGNPLAMIVNSAGKVAVRPLVLDRAIGDKWLVTSGLAPGDKLIVEGLQKARPDAPVKEVPFGSMAQPGAKPGNAPKSTSK